MSSRKTNVFRQLGHLDSRSSSSLASSQLINSHVSTSVNPHGPEQCIDSLKTDSLDTCTPGADLPLHAKSLHNAGLQVTGAVSDPLGNSFTVSEVRDHLDDSIDPHGPSLRQTELDVGIVTSSSSEITLDRPLVLDHATAPSTATGTHLLGKEGDDIVWKVGSVANKLNSPSSVGSGTSLVSSSPLNTFKSVTSSDSSVMITSTANEINLTASSSGGGGAVGSAIFGNNSDAEDLWRIQNELLDISETFYLSTSGASTSWTNYLNYTNAAGVNQTVPVGFGDPSNFLGLHYTSTPGINSSHLKIEQAGQCAIYMGVTIEARLSSITNLALPIKARARITHYNAAGTYVGAIYGAPSSITSWSVGQKHTFALSASYTAEFSSGDFLGACEIWLSAETGNDILIDLSSAGFLYQVIQVGTSGGGGSGITPVQAGVGTTVDNRIMRADGADKQIQDNTGWEISDSGYLLPVTSDTFDIGSDSQRVRVLNAETVKAHGMTFASLSGNSGQELFVNTTANPVQYYPVTSADAGGSNPVGDAAGYPLVTSSRYVKRIRPGQNVSVTPSGGWVDISTTSNVRSEDILGNPLTATDNKLPFFQDSNGRILENSDITVYPNELHRVDALKTSAGGSLLVNDFYSFNTTDNTINGLRIENGTISIPESLIPSQQLDRVVFFNNSDLLGYVTSAGETNLLSQAKDSLNITGTSILAAGANYLRGIRSLEPADLVVSGDLGDVLIDPSPMLTRLSSLESQNNLGIATTAHISLINLAKPVLVAYRETWRDFDLVYTAPLSGTQSYSITSANDQDALQGSVQQFTPSSVSAFNEQLPKKLYSELSVGLLSNPASLIADIQSIESSASVAAHSAAIDAFNANHTKSLPRTVKRIIQEALLPKAGKDRLVPLQSLKAPSWTQTLNAINDLVENLSAGIIGRETVESISNLVYPEDTEPGSGGVVAGRLSGSAPRTNPQLFNAEDQQVGSYFRETQNELVVGGLYSLRYALNPSVEQMPVWNPIFYKQLLSADYIADGGDQLGVNVTMPAVVDSPTAQLYSDILGSYTGQIRCAYQIYYNRAVEFENSQTEARLPLASHKGLPGKLHKADKDAVTQKYVQYKVDESLNVQYLKDENDNLVPSSDWNAIYLDNKLVAVRVGGAIYQTEAFLNPGV